MRYDYHLSARHDPRSLPPNYLLALTELITFMFRKDSTKLITFHKEFFQTLKGYFNDRRRYNKGQKDKAKARQVFDVSLITNVYT